LEERWNEANKHSLSDIWIATDGIGQYVRELRQAGITVNVRGLGDPRGELKFYNLDRFEKEIKAGRAQFEINPSDEVIFATAAALDDRIAIPFCLLSANGLQLGRFMPSPKEAYIYAAQLDLLNERAQRDNDNFLLRVLTAMEFGPSFLRDFAEKELHPSFARRARRVRDNFLLGVNELLGGRLLSSPKTPGEGAENT